MKMALPADFLLKRFEVLQKGDGRRIASICSDSRQAESGSLFVAIKGRRRDGHQHLDEAVRRGAAALLLERRAPWPADFTGAALKAPDSRSALSMALNEFYGFPSQKLFAVGVTGTNGKTTVSYMLEWIFSRCGWPAGVIGTIDQHFKPPCRRGRAALKNQLLKTSAAGLKGFSRRARLTTPEPVELFKALNEFVKRGARALIMEASSIGLDQKRAEGIDFRGAVFTNLSQDHLDYHLSMDKYFRAKKRLFELAEAGPPVLSLSSRQAAAPRAQKNFFCLINKDDEYGQKLLGAFGPPYYSYGRRAADFCFEIQSQSLRETVFLLKSRFGDVRARLPLAGVHNVYNAAAAAGCAAIAGFSLKEAALALESFPGVPGRLQEVSGPDDLCQVFVDYAHAPLALRAALQTLKPAAGPNSLIAVFGCGGGRDRQKRPDMVRTALECADLAILTSDNPRHEDPESIIKEALRGADKKSAARLQAITDRREAVQKAISMAKKGDIVLIAGKGHEAFQIIGGKSLPFDDRETAREFLKRRRE